MMRGEGVFVAVAGPSGSGKDSVLNYARARLGPLAERIVFARRIITRAELAGSEAHDTLTAQAFEQALRAGHFALSWDANGLRYALPASLDEDMRRGRVVVANVSRAAILPLRERYAHVVPVIVTAPRAVLAERLAARGRESRMEVEARLVRAASADCTIPGAHVIDNAGALEIAGERFLALLREACAVHDNS